MDTRRLVGQGHAITLATLPAVALAAGLSSWHPEWFAVGGALRWVGVALAAVGVPIWLAAAARVAREVPRRQLITGWPFSWVCHPLYSAVGLLVVPGLGLALGSWIWAPVGAWLYAVARVRSRREEAALEAEFGEAYRRYRAHVRLPWV
jgi:protein-S-isoprenylcysteine O-methyltransferase Ste14